MLLSFLFYSQIEAKYAKIDKLYPNNRGDTTYREPPNVSALNTIYRRTGS